MVPSNITLRRNLISKPSAWATSSYTLKNLIEFKNADTVLIEGNTIENNWAAAQEGYSILLTPRNQNGTAPWSVVRDVVGAQTAWRRGLWLGLGGGHDGHDWGRDLRFHQPSSWR